MNLFVVPNYTDEILLGLTYLFKEDSENGKTVSSIDDIAKTKEEVKCSNSETLYNKLRVSDLN